MLGETPRPPTIGTIAAMLQASLERPHEPVHPTTIPPTHGLMCQKIAELLRADYPPVTAAELQQVRDELPDLINLGQKWAIDDDPMTSFAGHGILAVMIGVAIGLRRVPWSITEMLSQYHDAAMTDRRVMGCIIAGVLRQVFPRVSDWEFRRTKEGLPYIINNGEVFGRSDHLATAMTGLKYLYLAWGMKVGFGMIPMTTLVKEFSPQQL